MPLGTRSKARIEELRNILSEENDEKLILFITGAGISEESGVPLYRLDNKTKTSNKTVIWNSFVEDWCTTEKFINNPTHWYKHFWEKTHMTKEILNAKPNLAHESIARLCRSAPQKYKLITQNVDCLHRVAGTPNECLIEGHGSHDFYRCINYDANCIKSRDEPIEAYEINNEIKHFRNNNNNNKTYLHPLDENSPPRCPVCKTICMPMILTFGEPYTSHKFFQWNKAKKWMLFADVIVFVGTSFSVTLTDFALLCSLIKNNKYVYSINKFPKTLIEFNFTDKQFENVSKMWKLIDYYKKYYSSVEMLTLLDNYQKELNCKTLNPPLNPTFSQNSILLNSSQNSKIISKEFDSSVKDISENIEPNFLYMCKLDNWQRMDESVDDQIMNTAYYKNICTMMNSASIQFQQLGF